MKMMKLAIAAALAAGTPAVASASTPAEGKIVASAHADAAAKRVRWVSRRVCTVTMRRHNRVRTCRVVRVRR